MPRNLGFLLLALALTCVATTARASRLTGRVVDAGTGTPVAGVNLVVQGLSASAQTDSLGRYAIRDLRPGTYVLRASRVGYAASVSRVRVSGEETALDLQLTEIALPGEAVVVTATRAVHRETPVTFSNITRSELEERYTTQGIPTLLSELPSSTTYSETGNNIGYTYLTLRGFDQRRISVMINGIPQNDPEDHNVYWVNFPDLASSLEDVQVQRGSGSAFYGPAAIGGSINLVTDRFSPSPRLTLTSGYGSYDTRRLGITLNSGLLDNRTALYAHFSKTQSDGYRDGAWVDFLSYFFGAAHYTERTETRLHVYGSLNRDHLNYYGIPRDWLTDPQARKRNPIEGPEEIEDFHQPHYELLHEWTLSPRTTLSNAFFYVQGGGFFDFDGSWADTTYFRLTADNGFTPAANPGQSLIRAYVNNRQGGWLPRISYRGDRFQTEAGLELRYHRSLHWGKIRWAESLPSEMDPDYRFYEYKGAKWILAAYVNQAYRLTPRLKASGKLHLAHKRYRLYDERYVGHAFAVPFTFLNPQVGVTFDVTDRVNAYASLARTSREPRLVNFYDAAGSSGGAQPQFERLPDGAGFDFDHPLASPERLNNLELGASYGAPRLRLSANLFWMDFRDEIVKNGQLDLFGQPVTGNAERTLHRGVELAASARPARGLTLQGNLSLSRNTFKRHTVYEGGNAVALDGNRIAGFPDLLANARASYEASGVRVSLSLQHVGRQYTDNTEDNRKHPGRRDATGYTPLVVEPYTLLNLGLAYDLGPALGVRRLELRLDVNNLTDALYASHGEGLDFFPGATRNAFLSCRMDI